MGENISTVPKLIKPLIACLSFFSLCALLTPPPLNVPPLGSPTSVLCLILRRENALEGAVAMPTD